MYCVRCGTQLKHDQKFCSNCGQAIYPIVDETSTTETVIKISPTFEELLSTHNQTVRKYRGKTRAAGIIQIITSSLWGIITFGQIIYILNYGMGTTNLLVAVWNTIMTVYGIIEGARLLHGGLKESKVGLRAAIVNIGWYLVQAIVWRPFVILFMFFEIAIFILLLTEIKSENG